MIAPILLREFTRALVSPDSINELRRSVLKLAVRGRLVKQDPGDGDASDLLLECADVRSRASATRAPPALFAAGSLPSTGAFTLPKNWAWSRLEDVASFAAGRTPSRNDPSYWDPPDHHWVSIADMPDGGKLVTTRESVSCRARNHVFNADPCPSGTMLMSFKLTIGKIARLVIPAFHNEAIIAVRPYVTGLDPYLFLILPEQARQGATKGAIKGATLNRRSLSEIRIPLPPLAEQHRIVAKVDELMALCDELEAAQTHREARRDRLRATSLRNLVAPEEPKENARFFLRHSARMITRPEHVVGVRQAILDLAVRGRLVPQNPGDRLAAVPRPARSHRGSATEPLSGGLPSGWVPATLGAIANIRYGFAFPSETFGKSSSDGMPLIKIGDIGVSRPTVFVRGPYDDQYLVKSGDLLLGLSGSIKCARWAGPTALLNQRIARLVPGGHDVHPQWLFLTVTACLAQWQRETSKLTVQNIKAAQLREGPAPLPPLSEQRRIVAKVNELMAVCDELGQSLATEQTEQARLLEALLHDALEDALPARELELLGAR